MKLFALIGVMLCLLSLDASAGQRTRKVRHRHHHHSSVTVSANGTRYARVYTKTRTSCPRGGCPASSR